MELAELFCVLMFVGSLGLLFLGFPVAFTLGGAALLFGALGLAFDVFQWRLLGAFPQRIFGFMTTDVLLAVPMFIVMGVILERSRVAEDMLEGMGRLLGSLPGGLGIAVTIVGALLAASTGVIGATVVTMGLIALPVMLRRGYDPGLATGTICASGTLCQIIPPALVLVFLGDFLAYSQQQAKFAMGQYGGKSVGVIDLFAGALIPGLLLAGLYIVYQFAIAVIRPEKSPPIPPEDFGRITLRQSFLSLVAPLLLIVAVLGSILAGIATPTESAAIGAIGALYLAGLRQDGGAGAWPAYAGVLAGAVLIVLHFTFDLRPGREVIGLADQAAIGLAMLLCVVIAWGVVVSGLRLARGGVLVSALQSTAQITAMVFTILIGAAMFTLVFRGFGGDDIVHDLLVDMPGGAVGAVIAVMAVMFILGCFLDTLEIMFVVVPVTAPVLLKLGIDPVWLGVLIAVNLQTSFLTPPFGFALFYLRGVAPPEVQTTQMYWGVIPFLCIQILMLVLLWFFPALATWLPEQLYGK